MTPIQKDSTYSLHNGVDVPIIALGTSKTSNNKAASCVMEAVEAGYTSIDTAAAYQNQRGVGQGIAQCALPREKLYITSKVWNASHGYEKTLKEFNSTLDELGLDYIDQFLIHWPGPNKTFIPTWKALEKLYADGLVRVIGVCNFNVHHIEELMQHAEVMPMVNQIELHPLYISEDVVRYCKEQQIQIEAWRPICHGAIDSYPLIAEIAARYGKSSAQITLRWHLQRGFRPLPKTVNRSRMEENLGLFDFDLTDEEIRSINSLNQGITQAGEDRNTFFRIALPEI
ncbi:MAG: aldo/keto reductase [Christensenellales bacterium]